MIIAGAAERTPPARFSRSLLFAAPLPGLLSGAISLRGGDGLILQHFLFHEMPAATVHTTCAMSLYDCRSRDKFSLFDGSISFTEEICSNAHP